MTPEPIRRGALEPVHDDTRHTPVLPVNDLPSHGALHGVVQAHDDSARGTTSVNLRQPAVALAIGAHPDDVEFGCGGTLAKWGANGCTIHLLVLTDGSKGTWDARESTAALVEQRHREQRAAAHVLGGDVTFLDWPDGELEAGVEQRRQVCRSIRKVRPDVVLGHDPWRRYRLHPDHRNAGWLLTDGVVAARDPKFFPELGDAAHRPSAILLWEADEPNHVEDVGGWLDAKVAALLAHRSQYRSTMGIHDDRSPDDRATFRAAVERQLAAHGRLAGIPAGEAFRLLTEV